MMIDHDPLLPDWPDVLQDIDIVQARFCLEFISPCHMWPVDFLDFGRLLRNSARQLFATRDAKASRNWQSLFQPALSDDPVARRRFQKPAPAFVVTIPVEQERPMDAGDRLELEVLFIGSGIPLIPDFLSSLIHLGQSGLLDGAGCFNVTEVYTCQAGQADTLSWQEPDSPTALTCTIQPLAWLLQRPQVTSRLNVEYITPTRLMVDGRPLRRPDFSQVFPFMLRRVTSMLHAHGGVEVLDDPAPLLQRARELELCESHLKWQDWRILSAQQGLTVGGFVGEMILTGRALEDLYWVIAAAALFGLGKGATYGAGRFRLWP